MRSNDKIKLKRPIGLRGGRAYDLLNWYGAATKRLEPEVIQRLWPDYSGHYLDAYEEGLAQGMAEAEAHEVALASLGKAKQVNRLLRKTHLTEADVQYRYIIEGLPNHKWRWASLLFLLLLIGFPNEAKRDNVGDFLAYLNMALTWGGLLFLVAVPNHLFKAGYWRAAYATGFVGMYLFLGTGLFVWCLDAFNKGHQQRAMILTCAVVCWLVAVIWGGVRIVFKVKDPKMGKDG